MSRQGTHRIRRAYPVIDWIMVTMIQSLWIGILAMAGILAAHMAGAL